MYRPQHLRRGPAEDGAVDHGGAARQHGPRAHRAGEPHREQSVLGVRQAGAVPLPLHPPVLRRGQEGAERLRAAGAARAPDPGAAGPAARPPVAGGAALPAPAAPRPHPRHQRRHEPGRHQAPPRHLATLAVQQWPGPRHVHRAQYQGGEGGAAPRRHHHQCGHPGQCQCQAGVPDSPGRQQWPVRRPGPAAAAARIHDDADGAGESSADAEAAAGGAGQGHHGDEEAAGGGAEGEVEAAEGAGECNIGIQAPAGAGEAQTEGAAGASHAGYVATTGEGKAGERKKLNADETTSGEGEGEAREREATAEASNAADVATAGERETREGEKSTANETTPGAGKEGCHGSSTSRPAATTNVSTAVSTPAF